jgi:hypothetical protein
VVPAGKTLVVNDGVTISTGTFAVVGTLQLGTVKAITVSGAGTVVGDQTVRKAVSGSNAIIGPAVTNVEEALAAFESSTDPVDVAMVTTATVTDIANANFKSGKTLFVSGKLDLGTTVPAPAGAVVALGTVSVGGDLDLSSVVASGNGKLDITNATLTNTAAAKVTLPGTVAVKAIKAG